MSLKQQTISGFFWNFIQSSSSQLVGLLSTMILARLLLPADFGLIQMTLLFTALGHVFVDSGFSQALIRKQDCTNEDYSTVFYVNLGVSLALMLLLILLAPAIAAFMGQERLTAIIRILSLTLPINAFSLVDRAQFAKRMDFKTQAFITFIGVSCGLIVAVAMAFAHFGVWSLVGKILASQTVVVILFWVKGGWKPQWIFSLRSFKELFGFGSKLLVISAMATFFKNTYSMVIGKMYSAQEAGYYGNGDSLSSLPAFTLSSLFNNVAYPALSKIQHDDVLLKSSLKRLFIPMALASFTMLFCMIAAADTLIPVAFGKQWLQAIPYFRYLSLAYTALLLHTVNQVVMNVKGRSDYFMWTEIVKYILFIPIIVIGIKFGIKALMIGYAVHYWIGYFLNAAFTRKLINYGIGEQLKDIIVPVLFALGVSIPIYLVYVLLQHVWPESSPLVLLIIQVVVGAGCLFGIGEGFKVTPYLELKQIAVDFFKR